MLKHSILPPSSAAKRMACPGSRALEALYPEEMTEEALEGQAAHWIAAKVLQNPGITNLELPPNLFENISITSEMLDGALIYADHIKEIVGTDHKNLHIEERVDISSIHPECWGTPDAWYYNGHTLHIWDYKFGYKYVEVFENWQLIEYAAGIINLIDSSPVNIEFCIIQPRSFQYGPIHTWKINFEELEVYFEKLKISENKAMSTDAQSIPSFQCGNCKARFSCTALQETTLSIADTISMPHMVIELSNTQIGKQLKYLKKARDLLDARINGLESQATSLLKKGERIYGFHLEQSMGREKWNKSHEEIKSLGDLFGINIYKEMDFITPRQAIKAGIPEDLVIKYSEKSLRGFKLVQDDMKTIQKILKDR